MEVPLYCQALSLAKETTLANAEGSFFVVVFFCNLKLFIFFLHLNNAHNDYELLTLTTN